ncbi:FAD-dependent oxidoreductase [Candidatus Woesearchaeota archaeon]|nr:FAD-dependent oxidoreductase [Candidatus Woesearchaeota archaeon]
MRRAIIVGGGAVGLAVATEIADLVDELYVVEKEKRLGEHGSSRSSEVIHSGIYYKPGSQKAIQCIAGNAFLSEFCKSRSVPYSLCGKLIVAAKTDELPALDFLEERARQNGVFDVRLIDADEVKRMEPNVRCLAALHVPTSGVLDSAAYLHTLKIIAERKGVHLVCGTEVTAIKRRNEQFAVTTKVNGEMQEPILVDILVNAAGVYADKVAQMINPENNWKIQPIKGESMYFHPNREELQTGRHLYSAPLTYTLPDGSKGHTTGVHTTWKLDGRITVTPLYDTHPKDKEDYEITHSPREFLQEITGFFPHLKEEDLHPDQAGIQPKLSRGDFVIEPDKEYPDAYHCVGIDSPGLTASLAIGKYLRRMIEKDL